MRALTVQQPYAELIIRHGKRVENRTWPHSHRGALVIHASKSKVRMTGEDERRFPDIGVGVIVGIVNMIACVRSADIDAGNVPDGLKWLTTHPYVEGPWCWVFDDEPWAVPRAIPYKGNRGMFDIPDSVILSHAEPTHGKWRTLLTGGRDD